MDEPVRAFASELQPVSRTHRCTTHEQNRISAQMLKRGFDLVVAVSALLLASPLMLLLAILVRLDSPGPAIFRQTRVGRRFREFRLLKFRSMINGNVGAQITCGQEARITRVGAIIRKLKLDELPQMWNVFCGDMSFVGPRPEVPTFVAQFRSDYEEILKVRPGITDPASIRYRSESEILSNNPDPIRYYTEVILPDKIRISKEYVRSANIRKDISVIFQTIATLMQRQEE
jgi:lipopolysaccharide/colanic/teichoic acid biosynthesis glycosyltransferase